MTKQKKILIADDEPVNLDFFDLMFTKLGFDVEKAKDGQEALEKIRKFHPDLILLDNVMPKMTGFELTKILKSEGKYKDIPIVMLSALDDVRDKVEGFELGVEDYITKPFNFYEVLARIKAVLRNREIYTQLLMAEELNSSLKLLLKSAVKTIDELDGEHGSSDKTKELRSYITEMEQKIDKTTVQWEDIKKNDIGLDSIGTEIRNKMNEE